VRISVVITTYNRPEALTLVLRALAEQTERDFEVLVADDGSTEETAAALASLAPGLPYPLRHVWQPDEGFRAPMSRNRASAQAAGDYIVFLDGDCLPLADFIARHRVLAAPGWFVTGNRILLDRRLSERATSGQLPLWRWSRAEWLRARLAGRVNRVTPVLRLAGWSRERRDLVGAKTCNLALWRADLLAINGFDEEFVGWGYEDSDLVQRLFHLGRRRRSTRWAVPVLHLWHESQDRSRERANFARLERTRAGKATRARRGIDQYPAGSGSA
jgi:glycosyltransferase involved in cell wall biosynthesis